MQYRNIFILCLLFVLPLGLRAQILDDTTKLVYGPTTTTYIREGSLYYQTNQQYYPDTLVRNFYRILPSERSGYRIQTLENTGTAQAPIFYTLPEQIGNRPGFTVYDYWFNEPSEIRYYNTRSPFTRLFYSQGGDGRSWVEVTHARNVNPRWNVGVDFTRLTAEQQIDPNPSANQRNQVTSTAYDLFTRYQSENDRYALLANFSRLKHTVRESGGIFFDEELPEDVSDIIFYEDSPRRLANARSSVLRINYHLYHQYKLLNAFQLYHIFDRESRTDAYQDLAPDSLYYNQLLPEELTAIGEDFRTRELKNQAGIKGEYKAGKWNAYLKHRAITFSPNLLESYDRNEIAAGGYLALQPDTLRTLRLEAEVRNLGQYRFEALAQNRWLSLRYQHSKYKPAFIYEYRNTLLDVWSNDFDDPVAHRLEAALMLKLGPLALQPGLQLSVVQKPLYFRAASLDGLGRPRGIEPVQGDGAQIISPRLAFSMKLGKRVFWEGDAQYTLVTGSTEEALEAFQVPDWLFNTSLFYEGPMFGGNLYGQLGVDVHMKAAYFANAYDPVLRQFVVQQDFLVPSYPIANLFFGFRINTTRVFARLSHFNQGLTGQGYFTTPYYNGLERTFDIGIDWLFFD